uniref:glycosyltransferase family 2 protein n=1 Tax=uncultured Mucilaginibacter sp. TaxID=797541 RepID=UPI0025CDDD62
MPDLKITLITVSFNAESTIECCLQSVLAQSFKNIEYIIIDGASTDNTLQIIHKYDRHFQILVSEPDKGIYDAMNKGIKMASGDIIGMLNADDFFAYDDALNDIANLFNKQNCDIVFADLDYVDHQEKVIRKWRSGEYTPGKFNWGWMPPHPTFYCKKNLFQQYGFYSLAYGTAADYELMLRFMHKNPINACYLKKVIINMKIGGISNKNLNNRVKGLLFDLKAMRI